jgi:hypothetical protein
MRQGPLAGRYPAAAAMVIFALVPYLGLSAALQPLTPIIGQQLHMSMQTMSLALGMANAGYAVGTVLAVQFAQLLPQRRMMVLYAALLVVGSVLAAAAQNPAMFIAGVLSVSTFEDSPPADASAPRDPVVLGLAASGCVAAFYGASELLTHPFLGVQTFVPLVGGLALIIALIVNQYRAKRPLLTIRSMVTSTVPVAGIVVALAAAAASVTATALTAGVLAPHYTPLHLGLLFLPELAGALLTAVMLGLVLDKRQLHYLPLVGMAFLAAGIAVFRVHVPPTQALTLVGSALTGIGLGAAVAPALFVAGFSLPAASLQRVFAIVELLRAVAAFMIAPVFAHFAATVGPNANTGTSIVLWIGLGIAVGGAVAAVMLYMLGGARPRTPDLERFMDGEGPAWYSPPLLAAVRNRARHRALAEETA